MGIMNKFKDLIGMDEYEDEEEYITNEGVEEEEARPAATYSAPQADTARKPRNVSITSLSQLQVVLVKPDQFNAVKDIADHLNSKKTVVLNLESADKDTSRRLVDFLSGVAYANGGRLQKVATNTFIIIPYNVDMKGEILDELESNGIFF